MNRITDERFKMTSCFEGSYKKFLVETKNCVHPVLCVHSIFTSKRAEMHSKILTAPGATAEGGSGGEQEGPAEGWAPLLVNLQKRERIKIC